MSASQEWSDALKAGMGLHDDFPLTGGYQHDVQADLLPTSTQSPQRSPQQSPDSQHKDGQHNVGTASQQEQHVSQSYVAPYSEQSVHGTFSGEPHHLQSSTVQSDKNTLSGHGHPQRFTARPSQFGPRGPQDSNVNNLQSQPRMVRPSQDPTRAGQPHQPQPRPMFSNAGPRYQHGPRMSNPGQPFSKQNPGGPQNQINPGGPQQQINQGGSQQQGGQQQSMNQGGQQQMNPGIRQQQFRSPAPGNSPNKTNAQNVRAQTPGQVRPGQFRSGVPPQNIRHPISNTGNQFTPPRHQAPQVFPAHDSQQRMVSGPGTILQGRPEYPDEMFEDDFYDEDYDDEMEEDEEMYDGNYPRTNVHYGFPDSDSDEISEEESMLLEELNCCEDEERYEEIMNQLREKGVDPEELDEIMYHRNMRNYQPEMYNEDSYDEEDGEEGEEDENEENMEEEGCVSSSSQRQLGVEQHLPQVNLQHRGPNTPGYQAGHKQSPMYPGSQQNIRQPMKYNPAGSYQPHMIPGNPSQPGWIKGNPSQRSPNPKSIPHLTGPQGTPTQRPPMRPQLSVSSPTASTVKLVQPSVMISSNNLAPGQTSQNKPTPQHGLTVQQTPISPTQQGSSRPMGTTQQGPSQPMSSLQQGASQTMGCVQQGPSQPVGHSQQAPSQSTGSIQPGASQPMGSSQQGISQSLGSNQLGPQLMGSAQQGPSQTMGSAGQLPSIRGVSPRLPSQTVQQSTAQIQPELSAGQPRLNNNFQSLTRPSNAQQPVRPPLVRESSEASLARLEVQHMQQILDEEIKAKKGGGSSRQLLSNQTPALRPQQQPVTSGYQPKHQLPPRQPIPAICDPNSSALLTSGGRPVCSVVPFTTRAQASAQRLPVPAQPPNSFVRPRAPSTISVQTNSPSPSSQVGFIPPPNSTTPSVAPPVRGQMSPVQNSAQVLPQSPFFEQAKPQDQQSYQPSQQPSLVQAPSQQHPSLVQQMQPSFQQMQQLPSSQQVQQLPSSQQTQQLTHLQHSPALPQMQQQPTLQQTQLQPSVQQAQQQSSLQQAQHTSALQQTQQLPSLHQTQQAPPLQQTQHQSSIQQMQPTAGIQYASQGYKSHESFSLESLSEDKCILKSSKGNDRLTKGMVYQIRSPKDQALIYALWNGEKFEDLKDEDLKAIQSKTGKQRLHNVAGQRSLAGPITNSEKKTEINVRSQVIKGDNSKFQAEFLQSLAGKHWTNSGTSCSTVDADRQEQCIQQEPVQTRIDQDIPNNQSTYVKPLAANQKKEDIEEDDELAIFKKPFPEQEEYFRVCKNCGYTSKNFRRCDGCFKVFQGEVKVHTMKKNTNKALAGPSEPQDPFSSVMEEVNFYSQGQSPRGRGRGRGARGSGRTRGGGMKGRAGARGSQDSSNSDTEDSVEGKRSSDSSASSFDNPAKKRPSRQKSKNPAPKKRSKKQDEPVTLTISSDEDEPSSTSSHAPSPAHSAGGDSPIFPSLHSEPVNAFGRFRRVLMEDEDGISKLSKKMKTTPPLMDRCEEDEDDEDDEDDDEVPIYEIDIRSVRIGSMRTQPEGPLMINMRGICFKVRSERTEEAFECEILAQDVELVKYFSGQTQPVLFLLLTQESGEKLREICHMEPGDDEYFDPSSTDMKQKMVVIIIESFNYMPEAMLKETLSLWADMNQMDDDDFIEELTEEGANDLLIQSAPPVLTANVDKNIIKFKKRYISDCNDTMLARAPLSPSDSTDNEPDSTSSSPPETRHFLGTNARLLQYPPPPLRGIPITTEDLYCLTEGEFLNDVIIDFYLQYLYLERLSPANRQRTHIFSSFFYKRLTQRDRHVEKSEEDAKKSLPERRHARVKKWTKTVDLFSKDFIIVPINEHSHWYLAVICFPGLAGTEKITYVPNNCHAVDEDSTDNGGTEEEPVAGNSQETRSTGSSTSQEARPKTILGRHLDPNEPCEVKCDGIRQPCILMFDSLAGPSRNPNVKMLREYLQCEWNAKKTNCEPRVLSKIIRGASPRVPQQSNYSDCGVYLLQYVESFFEDPIGDFQIPMKGLQNWFPEELVLNKRRYIHELIMSLHRRYQEERGETRIMDIKYDSTPREPPMRIQTRPEESMNSSNRDDESSNSSMSADTNNDPLAALQRPPLENFLLDRSEDDGSLKTSSEGVESENNMMEPTEMSVDQPEHNI
ncbi:uncharacterized protein LOC106080000 isoform X4 [Biomphalaria glabrata]|uniref:Uncharacterized protein LOC106080000 isoform X4 n=1 Tax=Biomphalaria glabrata TaxID=6526 RepID=A0A9W3AK46_BIOGL|nr:uncharacterized protein LOC106080000 isoform X4 [Biomphalaria glabrata]